MEVIKTKILSSKQWSSINELWNAEYPVKLKDRFGILLDGVINFNHYLIEGENNEVVAWAVAFEKDNQIRFSLIVSSAYKGKGLGGFLIDVLKQANKEFYGWVIDHNEDLKSDGTLYRSPMPFYVNHGFDILNDKRIDTEMIRAVLIKWSKV